MMLSVVLLVSSYCFSGELTDDTKKNVLALKCNLVDFGKNYNQIFTINTTTGDTHIAINLAIVDTIKRKGTAKIEKDQVNIIVPKAVPYQACNINIKLTSKMGTSACDESSFSDEKLLMKLKCEEL